MSDKASTSWSGWKNQVVSVPGGGSGTPLLLEVRGGITSHFYFDKVTGSRPDGNTLVVTQGRRRVRIVLPADSDGFSVRRSVVSDGAGGFHRWHARLIEPGSLPTLSSTDHEGKGTETFGHFQEKRYHEQARVFRYEFEDFGSVTYHPATGSKPVEIPDTSDRLKGSIPLLHHGYVTISSPGKWKASIV
ncbi:hypothetical protein [Streptomyces sp. A5-4]|uniref:hypothetical protein n=1 Tax=Streptomyces sp. A5-4 TaxID=3384771 RepID=UPI003DA93C32